ncbi:hypothetical protein AB0454_22560 [Streptomyces sp. NPDC093509]|uniref:hypothetical protein n=1 Tax=Streptomyces sp. NPDC093509 TaxID=3154982 RepID=UPI00344EC45C
MSYTTTTSYGTWCNLVNQYSTSPDSDVLDYINGGDNDWQQLLEASGALDAIKSDYRAAIQAALPAGVSLCGDEFIGPAHPDDDEWDGYPVDDLGSVDIAACVEDIDLQEIVERNEVITLEEIGRFKLGSKAQNPSSAASQAMRRLGVKPIARCQIDGEGQVIAVFRAAEVDKALASRPGRGKRTDLLDTK